MRPWGVLVGREGLEVRNFRRGCLRLGCGSSYDELALSDVPKRGGVVGDRDFIRVTRIRISEEERGKCSGQAPRWS